MSGAEPSGSQFTSASAVSPAPSASIPAPAPPDAAAFVFGAQLGLAWRYARMLAGDGTLRGAIGPQEVPRLWERHLINSAALSDLIPRGARVVDVGSGAGLPGIPLAIRRPDLRLQLVEPMLRRTAFLSSVVDALALPGVEVVRGRAEDPSVRARVGFADWVVARAVAPLHRLVEWCVPLLSPDGRLLALKGARAAAEMSAARTTLRRLNVTASLIEVGATRVVEVRRTSSAGQQRGRRG